MLLAPAGAELSGGGRRARRRAVARPRRDPGRVPLGGTGRRPGARRRRAGSSRRGRRRRRCRARPTIPARRCRRRIGRAGAPDAAPPGADAPPPPRAVRALKAAQRARSRFTRPRRRSVLAEAADPIALDGALEHLGVDGGDMSPHARSAEDDVPARVRRTRRSRREERGSSASPSRAGCPREAARAGSRASPSRSRGASPRRRARGRAPCARRHGASFAETLEEGHGDRLCRGSSRRGTCGARRPRKLARGPHEPGASRAPAWGLRAAGGSRPRRRDGVIDLVARDAEPGVEEVGRGADLREPERELCVCAAERYSASTAPSHSARTRSVGGDGGPQSPRGSSRETVGVGKELPDRGCSEQRRSQARPARGWRAGPRSSSGAVAAVRPPARAGGLIVGDANAPTVASARRPAPRAACLRDVPRRVATVVLASACALAAGTSKPKSRARRGRAARDDARRVRRQLEGRGPRSGSRRTAPWPTSARTAR